MSIPSETSSILICLSDYSEAPCHRLELGHSFSNCRLVKAQPWVSALKHAQQYYSVRSVTPSAAAKLKCSQAPSVLWTRSENLHFPQIITVISYKIVVCLNDAGFMNEIFNSSVIYYIDIAALQLSWHQYVLFLMLLVMFSAFQANNKKNDVLQE